MREYTRREALAGLAVAARAADTAKASNYIDAHVHVWTPDTVRFPHDKRRNGKPVPPVSFTPEQLLTLAMPSGVSRIVLIPSSAGPPLLQRSLSVSAGPMEPVSERDLSASDVTRNRG